MPLCFSENVILNNCTIPILVLSLPSIRALFPLPVGTVQAAKHSGPATALVDFKVVFELLSRWRAQKLRAKHVGDAAAKPPQVHERGGLANLQLLVLSICWGRVRQNSELQSALLEAGQAVSSRGVHHGPHPWVECG
jgi:hypothetical protein